MAPDLSLLADFLLVYTPAGVISGALFMAGGGSGGDTGTGTGRNPMDFSSMLNPSPNPTATTPTPNTNPPATTTNPNPTNATSNTTSNAANSSTGTNTLTYDDIVREILLSRGITSTNDPAANTRMLYDIVREHLLSSGVTSTNDPGANRRMMFNLMEERIFYHQNSTRAYETAVLTQHDNILRVGIDSIRDDLLIERHVAGLTPEAEERIFKVRRDRLLSEALDRINRDPRLTNTEA